MSPDRRTNLITGTVVIALVALTGLYFLLRPLWQPQFVPYKKYVVYLEDSGGIRAGDRMRIKGRTAGRVTDVRVEYFEGRTRARVEIELAPGAGSQWLTDLPVDSTVSVRPARLLGRPQVNLKVGSSDTMVPPGGILRQPADTPHIDQLTEWRQDLDRFDDGLNRAMQALESPAVGEAAAQVAAALTWLQKMEAALPEHLPDGAELAARITQARESMDDLRLEARENGAQVPARLEDAAAQAVQLEDALKAGAESVGTAGAPAREAADQAQALQRQLDIEAVSRLGRDLRMLSARLRASMDGAVGDPSRFGNMPPSRFARPYYHGDTFRPGAEKVDSSLNEPDSR